MSPSGVSLGCRAGCDRQGSRLRVLRTRSAPRRTSRQSRKTPLAAASATSASASTTKVRCAAFRRSRPATCASKACISLLGRPTPRLVEGSTIRVGVAAQNNPFPSPTGIVDYDLRRVGERAGRQPAVELRAIRRLCRRGRCSTAVARERPASRSGADLYRGGLPLGRRNGRSRIAVAPRWRPSENRARPFFTTSCSTTGIRTG